MRKNHKTIIISTVILLLCTVPAPAEIFDHSFFDRLLKMHVRAGLVNYERIKEDPALLAEYLNQLERLDPTEYRSWGPDEKTAFWINAYNALVIYGVILNYPIKSGGLISRLKYPGNSVRQIPNFWDTPFHKVMGRDITLHEIEKDIFGGELAYPYGTLALFGLSRASISSPSITAYAYTHVMLKRHLQYAAYRFIVLQKGIRTDAHSNRLLVSPLFAWYGKDFKSDKVPPELMDYNEHQRGIVKFIADNSNDTIKEFILNNKPKLHFVDYDWTLNEFKK
jgi:hypothetical protein